MDEVTEKAVESTQMKGSELGPTPYTGLLVQSTVHSGMLLPEESAGGGSKTKSQYKPLKHWKSGECY